jgi:uncharacterized protein (DUF2141 family)
MGKNVAIVLLKHLKTMKTAKHLITLAFGLIVGISAGYGQHLPVKIKLSNIKNQKAPIHLGFYKQENDFPADGKQAFEFKATPNGKDTLTVSLPSVPPGDFAIAVYQDVNQNGRLDTNLFGMPKEPFGFSQNVHPKLSKPSFADCRITIAKAGQVVTITLID